MAKFIDEGWASKDDPMFADGFRRMIRASEIPDPPKPEKHILEAERRFRTIVRNQGEFELGETDHRPGGGGCGSQRGNDPLLSAAQTSGRAGEAIGRIPALSYGNGETDPFH